MKKYMYQGEEFIVEKVGDCEYSVTDGQNIVFITVGYSLFSDYRYVVRMPGETDPPYERTPKDAFDTACEKLVTARSPQPHVAREPLIVAMDEFMKQLG